MKEAWAANIPYVLAEMNYQRAKVEPTTPEGVYNAVLSRTQNKDLAEKMMTEAKVQQALAKTGTSI